MLLRLSNLTLIVATCDAFYSTQALQKFAGNEQTLCDKLIEKYGQLAWGCLYDAEADGVPTLDSYSTTTTTTNEDEDEDDNKDAMELDRVASVLFQNVIKPSRALLGYHADQVSRSTARVFVSR